MKTINKKIFKENLLKTIQEIISDQEIIDINRLKFVLIAVQEKDKPLNTKDEYMKLWCFSEKNIKGRVFTLDEVINIFSGFEPLYPIWINVSMKDKSTESILIEIQSSMRFRQPSLLHNQETGHAPFKAIIS